MEDHPIAATRVAHVCTARRIRAFRIVRGRVPRELRSDRAAPSPSGESSRRPFRESEAASVSKNCKTKAHETRLSGESFRDSIARTRQIAPDRSGSHQAIPSLPPSAIGDFLSPIKPHHPTPASRPVSMISRNSNLHPESHFRPR